METLNKLSQPDSVPPRPARSPVQISIATKFIVLIVTLLALTLFTILFNATHLFKRDNLDSIYLSSDIITSSKAGEARTWLESALNRAKIIGNALRMDQGSLGENEDDVQTVTLFVESDTGVPQIESEWAQNDLLHKLNLEKSEILKIRDSFVKSSYANHLHEILLNPYVAGNGKKGIFFLMPFPYTGSNPFNIGRKPEFLVVSISSENLLQIFSKTGPYSLALLDNRGRVLANTEGHQDLESDKLTDLPIVKRMLTSKLEREFQEFNYKDSTYLGAYQHIGVADLFVLSQVPKSVALESGYTLIRRSVLIGLQIFLVAFIITYLFVQRLISPIFKLRNAAREMSKGNFGVKVTVKDRDEIFDLAASFNTMSADIEKRVKDLQSINNASIKIRTMGNLQELWDYSIQFVADLLECNLALGIFFGGKKDPETQKPKVIYSRINWSHAISVKELTAALMKQKGITETQVGGIHFLVCPIIHKEVLTGMILLGGKKSQQPFAPEDKFLAQTVVAMISADTENILYSTELRELNAELEERVRLRTLDLAQANSMLQETNLLITQKKKELDDVMQNIQQGILTLNSECLVNADYSTYVTELFGVTEIENQSLSDIIFEPPTRETKGESLKQWIKSIFNEPDSFEMIRDFGISELEFARKDSENNREIRNLKFEWRPIFENGTVIKIMLVCFDLTEQKRLEKEIAAQEESHQEELEIISRLVNNSTEIVDNFVSDFTRNINEGAGVVQGLDVSLNPDSLNALMRSLHTIKGSARQFGLSSVQNRAHSLEDEVSAYRKAPPDASEAPGFLEKVKSEYSLLEGTLQRMIGVYEKIMGSSRGGSSPTSKKPSFTVPIEKIETLYKQVFAGSGAMNISSARKSVAWLVQAPIEPLFERLGSLAKSLAEDLQYPVEVVCEGEATPVDPRIIPLLYDSFLHAVRNSVDHGGSPAEERLAANKPSQMTLRLKAEQKNHQVTFTLQDDGKGIDTRAVLKKALQAKLISKEAAVKMTPQEMTELVFLPGFSTKDAVNELSGRGVGMEVVKDTVERKLGGSVSIHSELGKGTTVSATFSAVALFEQKTENKSPSDATAA